MAKALINSSNGRVRRVADDFPADYATTFPQWTIIDFTTKTIAELKADIKAVDLPRIKIDNTLTYQSPVDSKWYLVEDDGDFDPYWNDSSNAFEVRIPGDGDPTVIREATQYELDEEGV